MSQIQIQTQTPKKPKKLLEIEVPKEKARELYKFTDLYLHPKKLMTISDYQSLIIRWSERLIDLVFRNMCDEIFEDEKCPVDVNRIINEIFDVLDNEEFRKLEKELGIEWGEIEDMDNDIHVDDKIEIYPILKFEGDDYKIYLVIYELPSILP